MKPTVMNVMMTIGYVLACQAIAIVGVLLLVEAVYLSWISGWFIWVWLVLWAVICAVPPAYEASRRLKKPQS